MGVVDGGEIALSVVLNLMYWCESELSSDVGTQVTAL